MLPFYMPAFVLGYEENNIEFFPTPLNKMFFFSSKVELNYLYLADFVVLIKIVQYFQMYKKELAERRKKRKNLSAAVYLDVFWHRVFYLYFVRPRKLYLDVVWPIQLYLNVFFVLEETT